MGETEKRFLEQLAELIPGVKGYRDKEDRRETDKKLRETLSQRVDLARESLQTAKRELLDGGNLDLLGVADRIDRKLQRAADGLRYASYGYAGFFDQAKIREDELDRLYDYDYGLIANVAEVHSKVAGASSAPDAAVALKELETSADVLIVGIDKRKGLFDQPAE